MENVISLDTKLNVDIVPKQSLESHVLVKAMDGEKQMLCFQAKDRVQNLKIKLRKNWDLPAVSPNKKVFHGVSDVGQTSDRSWFIIFHFLLKVISQIVFFTNEHNIYIDYSDKV